MLVVWETCIVRIVCNSSRIVTIAGFQCHAIQNKKNETIQ